MADRLTFKCYTIMSENVFKEFKFYWKIQEATIKFGVEMSAVAPGQVLSLKS